MTVIWSGRDRTEKFPPEGYEMRVDAAYRPPAPVKRRHGGHITRHVSGPVDPIPRRWIPDKFSDRVIGWLWPRMREVAALVFWILVGVLLAVAIARPWE